MAAGGYMFLIELVGLVGMNTMKQYSVDLGLKISCMMIDAGGSLMSTIIDLGQIQALQWTCT